MRAIVDGVAALLFVAALGTGFASGGRFTVQVLAFADAARAVEASRPLIEAGFPAYVARGTGPSGDVYRVRVGAFADREGARRFAAAMPDVALTRPVPAVAEGFPDGLFPLLAGVAWVGEGEVALLSWPGGFALRHVDAGGVASLILVEGDALRVVAAAASEAPAANVDVPFVDLTQPSAPPATPSEGGSPLPSEAGVPLPIEATTVAGPPWNAASSDGFVTLATADLAPWRAAVGTLVWGQGDWLIARVDDQVLLLRVEAR